MKRHPECARIRAGALAIAVAFASAPALGATWRTDGENRIVTPAVDGAPAGAELFVACVGTILTSGVRMPGETFVGEVAIRYRFEDGKSPAGAPKAQDHEADWETDTWQAATEPAIVQLDGRARVEPFLKRLGAAAEFRIVAKPDDQAGARFAVSGLDKAAAPLLQTCERTP